LALVRASFAAWRAAAASLRVVAVVVAARRRGRADCLIFFTFPRAVHSDIVVLL
jgi:hypothetical protein